MLVEGRVQDEFGGGTEAQIGRRNALRIGTFTAAGAKNAAPEIRIRLIVVPFEEIRELME